MIFPPFCHLTVERPKGTAAQVMPGTRHILGREESGTSGQSQDICN